MVNLKFFMENLHRVQKPVMMVLLKLLKAVWFTEGKGIAQIVV